MLRQAFFDRDACVVAKDLLGKVINVKHQQHWLKARIIETEAYYLAEKGSHSSLGYTEKRKALYMPSGTIYMYYARGKDSLNVSVKGKGNAVLIKSGYPYGDNKKMLHLMQRLNPKKDKTELRDKEKLCAGQTLVCKSLGLRVADWDGKQFDKKYFYCSDEGELCEKIIVTTRLGIPQRRDEHLKLRFIDRTYAQHCTQNPLTKRAWKHTRDYDIIDAL